MSEEKNAVGEQIRPEEALDLYRLNSWLHKQIIGLEGVPTVVQFSGGASNWTYLLTYPDAELVLRRAPAGTKARSAHDMGREYRLQQALKPVFPLVPEVYAYCEDRSIIGSEFYVMEKVEGLILRKDLPSEIDLTKEQAEQLCTNMVDSLIQLHQVDYHDAGLESLAKGAGYMHRQVEGWNQRYQNARTWNVPSGRRISKWLSANMPRNETICLTHNDFRLDNMVLDRADPTKVVGVLDWELATLGDPLMDLGNTLAYWIEEGDDFIAQWGRKQPSHISGMYTRQQIIEYYVDRTGVDLEDFTFYEVFASFRLSGIAQQIYYRYYHRQSRNPAFKNIWIMVNYLHHRCRQAINRAGG
jgi:aminoglycoside phosphotransferase (APT) family kinase protein